MWILFAFGSALFAGLTAILAKIGIHSTDSNLATALRTVVVLAFSWLLVLLQGSWQGLGQISGRTFAFLILSGLATGASWLCYFRALQLGDVNKVTPIDKSSTLLTMFLAFVFFHEPIGPLKAACIVLIGLGTWLMIQKKPGVQALFRVPQTGAQRRGIFQPHPVKTGDSHRHPVFINARARLHLDAKHLAPHGAARVCRSKRHTHGFGAAQRRHHLLPQQFQHFLFCQHRSISPSPPAGGTIKMVLFFY